MSDYSKPDNFIDTDSNMCGNKAYPPGQHFAIPETPDVESVNAIGGLNIAHDRLAIVDGQG